VFLKERFDKCQVFLQEHLLIWETSPQLWASMGLFLKLGEHDDLAPLLIIFLYFWQQ